MIFFHINQKTYRVAFNFHQKRKILILKIQSHRTHLGHLGPFFLKGQEEIFRNLQFCFILDLNNFPVLVAPQAFAKNLNQLATRCGGPFNPPTFSLPRQMIPLGHMNWSHEPSSVYFFI